MINWKVRFKNPYFYVALLAAIFTPIGVNLGVNFVDITSWGYAWDLIVTAAKSPYMVGTIVMTVLAFVLDPTTEGIKDSKEALNYSKPKGDK